MTEGGGPTGLKIFFIGPSGDLAGEIAAAVEGAATSHDLNQWAEDRSPGTVTTQILQQINQADVIIADLSNDNPNVFYELGIAHTLGKPTILFKLKNKELPFDVYPERAIEVSVKQDGSLANPRDVENRLRSALSDVAAKPGVPSSTIGQYLLNLRDAPRYLDGWRAIAAAKQQIPLTVDKARLGTWIYEEANGLGRIVDVVGDGSGKQLRIQFSDGRYREMYFTEDASLFIAPPHAQEYLKFITSGG